MIRAFATLARAVLVLALLVVADPVRADEALWAALADGGHVALMRHAYAPGTGDPGNFRLDDCSTQRNLDQTGRDQARRTGEMFRERGVAIGEVLASQWCRCLETAELLALGEVVPFAPLNSFFGDRARGPAQTEAVRAFLAEADAEGPSLVMVTHQVNITALTGMFPRSGEIVVLRLGGPDIFATIGAISAL
ncbi:MAG: histidine phosphatase family protein [Geminicoccaceae bacterium]